MTDTGASRRLVRQCAELVAGSVGPRDRPRRISKILADVLVERNMFRGLEVHQRASELEDQVIQGLRNVLKEAANECIPIAFELNATNCRYIQGVAFDDPSLAETYEEYQRKLSVLRMTGEHDLELASVSVLRRLGFPSASLTRSGADEGIDFFALIPLRDHGGPVSALQTSVEAMSLWVLGQARSRREGAIAAWEVRDFAGAMELSRRRGLLADDGRRVIIPRSDLVVGVYVSNVSFTPDARRTARDLGILCLSGEHLARPNTS